MGLFKQLTPEAFNGDFGMWYHRNPDDGTGQGVSPGRIVNIRGETARD